MKFINEADEALVHVQVCSVCGPALSSDALLVLEIADRMFGGPHGHVDGRPFREFGIGKNGSEQKVCLFVSQPKEPLLAHSQKTPSSRFFGFVAIREDYLRAIRILCLRLWADSGVAHHLGGTEDLFFPQAPRSEIPWGLESLWLVSEDRGTVDSGTNELVPDWYESALSSMSAERKEYFSASVTFAVLFVILHEIGHLNFGHFGTSIGKHEQELQADGFAISEMLLTVLSPEDYLNPDSLLVSMSVGIAAAFILFHVFMIKQFPTKAGLIYHNNYPTASERFSQVFDALIARGAMQPRGSLNDLLKVITVFLEIGSLHPAFAFVIGTGWVRIPVDFRFWCVESANAAFK